MSLIPLGFWAASGGGAAAAFDLLETQVLASSAASVTFTGLGSYTDYKHLQIRMASRSDRASTVSDLLLNLNSDTGSNYAWHVLSGNGSAVITGAVANTTYMRFGTTSGSSEVSGNFDGTFFDILDFSNTNKNTTIRSLSGKTGNSSIWLGSGLYNSTNAITSLEITNQANFIAGSRFSIYGVK